MSLYKGTQLVAGGSQALPLLSFMWADHQFNHPSWLRAGTFSWQPGSVYIATYAHLSADITGKTLQSETVDGTTVQFYLADDGHKICPASEESNVMAIYNATGVAWYFIIDTTNQRFKLPRINPNREQLLSSAPVFAQAGTSVFNSKTRIAHNISGSVVATGYALGVDGSGINTPTSYTEYADLTAGGGSFSGKKYLYFYVGQFTQTALENTAGLNTEMFNDLNAHKVVEFQEPTSANNYTWYRKYADGWVEQGGYVTGTQNVSLPITMANTNYQIQLTSKCTTSNNNVYVSGYRNQTTTGFVKQTNVLNNSSGTAADNNAGAYWYVYGMAAN